STPRTDRPQGDYRRARKKQDRTAGVCHSKMLLPLQCHHGEDEDEKPQSKELHNSWKEMQWREHMEQMSRIKEHAILQNKNIPDRRLRKEPMTSEGSWEEDTKLVEVLQKNVDVFTWTLVVSTIVPRFVMEHQLKAYPLAEPMIHKKCPLNPDQRRVLKGKVFEWLKAGIIRKVQYPEWVANAMPVNQRDVTWQISCNHSLDIDINASYDSPRKAASIGTEETFNWTSEADKALQEIQKRLGKPHTLVVPKEWELLHPTRGGNTRRDGEEPS
ncbi:hypothetical protein Tco_0641105, partial [Tanacetum coccineum]